VKEQEGLRRAKSEADFARSGVVSNQGGAFRTIPRLGSGLFGLFRVVVGGFPPFFFSFGFDLGP
jgi:hypothetical protein